MLKCSFCKSPRTHPAVVPANGTHFCDNCENWFNEVQAQAEAAKPSMADAHQPPSAKTLGLPQGTKERKELPIGTGVLDYFPLALAEVARVSFVGNQQHNPGEPLHWAKEKSQDEEDCAIRHYLERYELDGDGTYHAAKAAWRMLAFLQKLLEAKALGLTYQAYNHKLREDAASAIKGYSSKDVAKVGGSNG